MHIFRYTAAALAGAALMYAAVDTESPRGVRPGPISSSQAGPVPCQVEDGSGPDQILPCRWDAQHSGNGRGYSFVVTKNAQGQLCYTYDSPKVQRKMGGCED